MFALTPIDMCNVMIHLGVWDTGQLIHPQPNSNPLPLPPTLPIINIVLQNAKNHATGKLVRDFYRHPSFEPCNSICTPATVTIAVISNI